MAGDVLAVLMPVVRPAAERDVRILEVPPATFTFMGAVLQLQYVMGAVAEDGNRHIKRREGERNYVMGAVAKDGNRHKKGEREREKKRG